LSMAGRSVPHPKGAYLRVEGGPDIPLGYENIVRELFSSSDELWLEVRLPDLEGTPEHKTKGARLLVVEFDFSIEEGALYLRNGYQSWSYGGLWRAGDPIQRPGADMAIFSHFSHKQSPLDDLVLAESEGIIAFEGLVACALDGRRAPACFFATTDTLAVSFDISGIGDGSSDGQALDVVVLIRHGPGYHIASIDRAVSASALEKSARAAAPLYTGWCSWYQYFSGISEKEFLKNLSIAEKELDSLDVFQLDDGFQRAIGDWTETNSKFPSGIEGIARRVADAGFIPGIWIAPFVATTESSLYTEHPDWFLKLPNGSPTPAMLNPSWGGNGFAYALDCTHEEVLGWLQSLGSALREAGFGYVKIDFCYAASMPGRSAAPAGRASALAGGVSALRKGLGDEVFLLGCGIPLWPSVGLVDGCRIGPDVAPVFAPNQEIYGLTHSLPAVVNAWRNTVARAFMHRRLWVNDPDCVMLRKSQTSLESTVAENWGRLIAALGQMFLISDDLSLYGSREFGLARELAKRARERDLPAGVPSLAPDPFDAESYPDTS
jgi:alpha-galactosidase